MKITKQEVQAVTDLKAGYTLGHADVAILNELARITLASLEAESIYQLWDMGFYGTDKETYDALASSSACARIVYTAPPAPVSVPDEIPKLKDGRGFKYVKDRVRYSVNYANGWNACRAAMLQGADGNSPVIPDGWKLVPIELTGDMTNAMSEAILDDLHNVDVWRSVLAAAPQQEVKS